MVTVSIIRDRKKRYLCVHLQGHAGQAEKGHDLVCASASILAYTVAQIVMAYDNHGDLVCDPIIRLNDGDAIVSWKCKDDESYADSLHTLFVAQTGYALLAHNFPQFVELNTVGEA